jgi:hypothetical protein
MRWDWMGTRWDRRLRRALLHCTALTRHSHFSLCCLLDHLQPSLRPPPSRRLFGSRALVTHLSRSCHVPSQPCTSLSSSFVFVSHPFQSNPTNPHSPPSPPPSLTRTLSLCNPVCTTPPPSGRWFIDPIHTHTSNRDPRSINFDQNPVHAPPNLSLFYTYAPGTGTSTPFAPVIFAGEAPPDDPLCPYQQAKLYTPSMCSRIIMTTWRYVYQ